MTQSYERAAEFYKLGAAKGHAGAQRCLGMLYCEGKGVSQDVFRGVALYKKAAAGGDKDAADVLRKLGIF